MIFQNAEPGSSMKKMSDGRIDAPNSIKKAVEMITTGKFALVTVQDALSGIINQDFARVG